MDENAPNRQVLGALQPSKKGTVPSVRPMKGMRRTLDS